MVAEALVWLTHQVQDLVVWYSAVFDHSMKYLELWRCIDEDFEQRYLTT
jgi:hypothetical protein